MDIGNSISDETGPEATEVLVFMAVAVTGSWKVLVCCFLVHALKAAERANLVRQCLLAQWLASSQAVHEGLLTAC